MANRPQNNNVPIELHVGFFWDCELCGSENFSRGVTPSFTDSEVDYLKKIHRVGNLEGIGNQLYVLPPSEVSCKECGEQYEAYMQSL